MAIVGFNLKKILVERKGSVRGEVKVNTNMNILKIEKHDVEITKGKDVLSFEFSFTISYVSVADHTGNIADILFEGNVLYLAEPKETKEILDGWKNKEIPEDVRIRILNIILTKCNAKALVFEDDLGLPPHLPLPKFGKPQEKQEKQETKTKKK